jgi:uncharacterized protein (UPF0333 family)
MAEQINLASLIISIIILIVVVVLVFMICYYYNTNNNSTKSIQNPQALAAALYKNANKDNFRNNTSGCGAGKMGDCCVATHDGNNIYQAGTCTTWGNACSTGKGGRSCSDW